MLSVAIITVHYFQYRPTLLAIHADVIIKQLEDSNKMRPNKVKAVDI